MQTNIITIVGMRRTGTSIALALRENSTGFTLIGHDSETSLLSEPAVKEAVDRVEADLIRACELADIIVLAMPSFELEATLSLIGERLQDHTLVIDLTALKGPGIDLAATYLKKGYYIGARPVFAANTFTDLHEDVTVARADLFKNSVFCMMPSAVADAQAVETTVRFGRLLGATPYFVDPLEYDQLSLGVETLPGIAAVALYRSISTTPGWRDILRFADLPFAVGTMPLDVDPQDLAYHLLHDRQGTLRWLDGLSAELAIMRRLIDADDAEVLTAFLTELLVSRGRWLKERGDNDWSEEKQADYDAPTLGEHFLGGLARRRKDKQ
jgi:prephenate dehydrogenase